MQENQEGVGGGENGHDKPHDRKRLFGVNISSRAFLKVLSSHVLNSKTIASEFSAWLYS